MKITITIEADSRPMTPGEKKAVADFEEAMRKELTKKKV